jgi:hypothetical protein
MCKWIYKEIKEMFCNYQYLCSVVLLLFLAGMYSCKTKQVNSTTGWEYNNSGNGGFDSKVYNYQQLPYDMVFIMGGNYIRTYGEGKVILKDTIQVASFFVGIHEETNRQYKNYLKYLKKRDMAIFLAVLPDSASWKNILPADYFSNPVYDYYPVVGLTRKQINIYLCWKSDRINESILIREGIIKKSDNGDDSFSTEMFLTGETQVHSSIENTDPKSDDRRKVGMEDGIFLPRYRLPSQTEWSYICINLFPAISGYSNTVSDPDIRKKLFSDMKTYNKKYKLPNWKDDFTGGYFYPEKKEMPSTSDALKSKPVMTGNPNDFAFYMDAQTIEPTCEYRKDTFPVQYDSLGRANNFREIEALLPPLAGFITFDGSSVTFKPTDENTPIVAGFRCVMSYLGASVGK